jgi:acyl-CoA dehydrogenase
LAPGTRRDTHRPQVERDLVALAHEFAANEIRPVAASFDETEAFPTEVVRKAARIGLTCFDLPAAHGGGASTRCARVA